MAEVHQTKLRLVSTTLNVFIVLSFLLSSLSPALVIHASSPAQQPTPQAPQDIRIYIPIVMKNWSPPPPAVDLSLTKSDGDIPASPGSTITYSLFFQNNGELSANSVYITETLPENTSLAPSGCASVWVQVGSSRSYTHPIGNLNPGNGGTADFCIVVSSQVLPTVTQISNTASITDDGSHGADRTPANNTATRHTPLVFAPDLSLSKSDGGITATPGSGVNYTLDYANLSNTDANGIIITETLPVYTTFNVGESTVGWQQVGATSQFTFHIASLAANSNGSIIFAVTTVNPAPAGLNNLSNSASITDDSSKGVDPNPANNTATDITPVIATPDLAITKSDEGVTAIMGGTVVYTLNYVNTGNQEASGVVITETLPDHTSFNSAQSSSGWNQVDSTRQYALAVGSLAGGQNGSAIFTVAVDDSISPTVNEIINTTSISDDGTNGADPTPLNNTASIFTPILKAPDLRLTKNDGGITTGAGKLLVYTLNYSNTGNLDASGVVITENLPEHAAFIPDQSSDDWERIGNTSQYTFAIDNLAANNSGSVIFAIRISQDWPLGLFTITNTASIADDGSHGIDPTPDNNIGTVISPVTTGPTDMCGTISTDTTWDLARSPYILTCSFIVDSGATLTIDPGVVIKFRNPFISLQINGTLNAVGSNELPIIFTSYNDDSYGGDTNNDGGATLPSAGDWQFIGNAYGQPAQINLDYVIARFGGSGSSSATGMIYAFDNSDQNVSLSVNHSVIENSGSSGIYLDDYNGGSSLSVSNSTIRNNNSTGIFAYYGIVSATLEGNTFANNVYAGAYVRSPSTTITQNTFSDSQFGLRVEGGDLVLTQNSFINNTSKAANLFLNGQFTFSGNTSSGPARIMGLNGEINNDLTLDTSFPVYVTSLDVIGNHTLTIQPGVIMKFENNGYSMLRVNGTLNALGTEANPIVFTSILDDSYGGDTNQDGSASQPYPGSWNYIGNIMYQAAQLNFDHVIARFGGSPTIGMIYAYDNSDQNVFLSVNHSVIENSGSSGIYLDDYNGGSSLSVSNSTIRNNNSTGIFAYYGIVSATLEGNTFANNVYAGAYVRSPSTTITQNTFSDSQFGLRSKVAIWSSPKTVSLITPLRQPTYFSTGNSPSVATPPVVRQGSWG